MLYKFRNKISDCPVKQAFIKVFRELIILGLRESVCSSLVEYRKKLKGKGQEIIHGMNTSDTTILSHSHRTIVIILQMDYKDFSDNSLWV